MVRALCGIAALAATACLAPVPITALGFQCSASADCDSTTTCRRGLCQLPYPDATNTGVPPGTTLTPVGTDPMANIKVASSVTAQDITGCIEITTSNVTISKSRIYCTGFSNVTIDDGVTGTLLEDVELVGPATSGLSQGVPADRFTLRRANVHGVRNGANLGDDVTIESSYFHDLAQQVGVGAVGGGHGVNVVVRGNWMDNGGGDSALSLTSRDGPVDNVLIEGNYFDGGGWTLYIERATANPMTNVTVKDNAFGHHQAFGPMAGVNITPSGGGNVYDDTGNLVSF
jgi:hypothetical protein